MYTNQTKYVMKLLKKKTIIHDQDIKDSLKTKKVIDKSFESSKKNKYLKI